MLLLAVPILILANLWVRQGALITLAAQISMAVPPIPALAALLLLMPAVRFMKRVGIERRDALEQLGFADVRWKSVQFAVDARTGSGLLFLWLVQFI